MSGCCLILLNFCRPLEEGDVVNVDVSVYLNGCHGKALVVVAGFNVISKCSLWPLCKSLFSYFAVIFFCLHSIDNLHFHLYSKHIHEPIPGICRTYAWKRKFVKLSQLLGWTGDLNETFFVGKVDKASEDLVRSTYECLEKAIALGFLLILPSYCKLCFQIECVLRVLLFGCPKYGNIS